MILPQALFVITNYQEHCDIMRLIIHMAKVVLLLWLKFSSQHSFSYTSGKYKEAFVF